MTAAPIDATIPEMLAVDVEANADEDIIAGAEVSKINESRNNMEIDLEEGRNTENIKWHWT